MKFINKNKIAEGALKENVKMFVVYIINVIAKMTINIIKKA